MELLLSDDGATYRELAGAFQAELSIACANRCPVTPSVRLSHLTDWQPDAPRDLLVTIGNDAALQAARSRPAAVLYGLIPESTWQVLRRLRGRPGGTASAVYLEQPLGRQFGLIAMTMPPDKHRVGVLLGPESSRYRSDLEAMARQHGMSLHVHQATTWDQVGPAMRMLSNEIDVLLAVPDSLVFNRDSLYGILLTSYSAGIPVFGYSQALVTAGAMLGLFTTPSDMGRQLAIYSADYITRPEALPSAGPSDHFEIAINRNVADSLGYRLPDPPALRARLEASGDSNETAQATN